MAPRKRHRHSKEDQTSLTIDWRVPRWAKGALLASGWIAALMVGVLDLPAKINSFYDEAPKAVTRITDALLIDKTLTGNWSSSPEGDVIAKPTDPQLDELDGAPVEIELYVRGGEVEGVIGSGGLSKRYIYSQISIDGLVTRDVVEGTAWDAVVGKKTTLASFRLKTEERGGEPVLRFNLIGHDSWYHHHASSRMGVMALMFYSGDERLSDLGDSY